MASGASVESVAVQSGMAVCKTCIRELQTASTSLKRNYQNSGSGWKDQQYARLGAILGECCSALEKPIGELNECLGSLQKLLEAVKGYDDVRL